jgi:hypothetical protein
MAPFQETVKGDIQSRRLAAILAADIAGYSALVSKDEARTVRDLKGHPPTSCGHSTALVRVVPLPDLSGCSKLSSFTRSPRRRGRAASGGHRARTFLPFAG